MLLRVISVCLILNSTSQAEPPATPSRHADVMTYRDDAGRTHPVKTKADWEKRREQILHGMQQAMGPLPSRESLPDLDPKILSQVESEKFTRLTMTLQVEQGDRLPVYLYLPKQQGKPKRFPAMLALHPTGTLGKGIVAGESNRANRQYGRELAERGYVVLCPDYPSFGDYSYDFSKDDYVSGSMKGIFNHMRCVDYLQSRDDVHPDRIGVIGHSLGGHNAMFVGVFDERLKVIVSSCGWTPFHDYYDGKINGWTSDRYMPLLRTKYQLDPDKVPFDFYEIVAALAPRPFLSSSPLHDSNFDVKGVRKAEPVAREVYKLLGNEPGLMIYYPDCAHDFPPEMREASYQLIDRVLKSTK